MIEYAIVALALAIVLVMTMFGLECWRLSDRIKDLAERVKLLEKPRTS